MMRPSDYVWSLVSGLPKPTRNNRPLFMLKAWIDDSHMKQPPIYVLAGWVAPAEKWAPFSDAWREILRMKPSIEYFKFDEAIGLSGQFYGISEESRNEKLRLLVGLIEDEELIGVASLMPHGVFDPLFGRHPDKDIRNPYLPSFFSLIGRLVQFYIAKGLDEKIEFVFDYQPGSMKQVMEGWELFKTIAPPEGRKLITEHPPTFLDDKDFMPLQAADLYAGWLRMANSKTMMGEDAPLPLWGNRGNKIRELRRIWTAGYAMGIFREMFGRDPVKFTYTFQPWGQYRV